MLIISQEIIKELFVHDRGFINYYIVPHNSNMSTSKFQDTNENMA